MTRMMWQALAGLLVVSLMGCTPHYTAKIFEDSMEAVYLDDAHKMERQAQWVVHASSAVCLTPSYSRKKGQHNRTLIALDKALQSKFQQAFPGLFVLPSIMTLDQSLKYSSTARCELLVAPALVNYENNLNTRRELSEGKDLHPSRRYGRDKMSLAIEVYEVRTRRLLDSIILEGRQKFFASKEALPSDLFDEALQEYIYTLTGRRAG